MIMEKPSCIKEIKRLTGKLFTETPDNQATCISDITDVINSAQLNDNEKLSKIKQLCDGYGKHITEHME